MSECRWEWGKPDKAGLWYWGGTDGRYPMGMDIVTVRNPKDWADCDRWWAYICQIPHEPQKRKVKQMQVLYVRPSGSVSGATFFGEWVAQDSSLKPHVDWIKTEKTRVVEIEQ